MCIRDSPARPGKEVLRRIRLPGQFPVRCRSVDGNRPPVIKMTVGKLLTAKFRTGAFGLVGFVLLLAAWSGLSLALGETRAPSPLTVVSELIGTINRSPEIALQGGGTGGFL